MSRVESILIGLFMGVMCPLSFLVLGWWSSAALSIYHLLPISDNGIALAAFAGLGVGILLDIFGLKRWVTGFYKVDTKWIVPVYLFWSAIAVAFLMGLPLGVIALGIVGGVYLGRRMHYARANEDLFARSARKASIFTALVTGAEALFIGILALDDRSTMAILKDVLSLDQLSTARLVGAFLVVIGCLVLMAVQFWCTRIAAMLAFRMGKEA